MRCKQESFVKSKWTEIHTCCHVWKGLQHGAETGGLPRAMQPPGYEMSD